jgi:stage V sporulation protein SpoVS
VELEAVGAGAVNQAVKAVARARQILEPEGYRLVIILELVQVPLSHGSQAVVYLALADMYGG